MINVFGAASFDHETEQPLCFAVYAQGPSAELASFAERVGLQLVSENWNGQPLAAAEVMLHDLERVRRRVETLLDLLQQSNAPITWLQDFAPGLEVRGVNTNLYPSKEKFLEALAGV